MIAWWFVVLQKHAAWLWVQGLLRVVVNAFVTAPLQSVQAVEAAGEALRRSASSASHHSSFSGKSQRGIQLQTPCLASGKPPARARTHQR